MGVMKIVKPEDVDLTRPKYTSPRWYIWATVAIVALGAVIMVALYLGGYLKSKVPALPVMTPSNAPMTTQGTSPSVSAWIY